MRLLLRLRDRLRGGQCGRIMNAPPEPGPYIAPARYVLTVLHRKDPSIPPLTKGPGPAEGVTLCGLPLLLAELWRPVDSRDGDQMCEGCMPRGGAQAAAGDVEATRSEE